MTAPPSPVSSEILSSCCSTSDEGLQECASSEASSPELKRARRQNMRTKLDDIFNGRIHSDSPTETGAVQMVSNEIQEHASKTSYKSADEVSRERSTPVMGNSRNVCCSLPYMNLAAANECKGLDIDCSCCSHSVSEPTEISTELRTDRRDKVVSSYFSHFKQNHSPEGQSDQSTVETDDEEVAEKNEHLLVKETDDGYWKDNMVLHEIQESDVVILEDDKPVVDEGPQIADAETLKDCLNDVGANLCDCGEDYIAIPDAVDDLDEEDGADIGIGSTAGMESMSGVQNAEAESLNNSSFVDQTRATRSERGSMNLNTSAAESTGIEGLSPVMSSLRSLSVSPAGESLNKMEIIFENLCAQNDGLRRSQDAQNDSEQFLGRRIEKEFKSELEFSTVLTLAYVRVRDLTNHIDKAQEYLKKIDKNDDEEDINKLKYEIQALFDSRANLSLEQARWRTQFSNHLQQRKTVLASLKSRACRTEQTYFQLRKELTELEREQIIPKRKRSLISRIFSFGFVK